MSADDLEDQTQQDPIGVLLLRDVVITEVDQDAFRRARGLPRLKISGQEQGQDRLATAGMSS